jgi:hypothetical protein
MPIASTSIRCHKSAHVVTGDEEEDVGDVEIGTDAAH